MERPLSIPYNYEKCSNYIFSLPFFLKIFFLALEIYYSIIKYSRLLWNNRSSVRSHCSCLPLQIKGVCKYINIYTIDLILANATKVQIVTKVGVFQRKKNPFHITKKKIPRKIESREILVKESGLS